MKSTAKSNLLWFREALSPSYQIFKPRGSAVVNIFQTLKALKRHSRDHSLAVIEK